MCKKIDKEVPNEIIIVEGRDDTKRLIETFGPSVKTIETGGSALSRKVQDEIVVQAQRHGIIIFTDPDYQGQRLRRLVTELVPEAKQAFLTSEEADSGKKGASLGIEHASPTTIRRALRQVMTPVVQEEITFIPLSQLMAWGLVNHPQSAKRRQLLGEKLHIGHTNGKQLQKRLALFKIEAQCIEEILEEEGLLDARKL